MMDVKGSEFETEIRTGKLVLLHRRNISDALNSHGTEVTKELKRVTSTGSRSGRVYSYMGRKYRASAPGEAPAKRSGKLSNSFFSKTSGYTQMTVGNTAKSKKGFSYPGYLEPGYFDTDLDRPYFLVTINKLKPRLQTDLQNL